MTGIAACCRGSRWLLVVAGVFLALACASTALARAKDLSLSRITEARFVRLGGIEQWITIRGNDIHAPILLLVHGGPGDAQSPFVSAYAPYERDFVLVQWDQRGAGKTYGRYGPSTPNLSLERVSRDCIELAEYLRHRFPHRALLILGHSWGTVIATEAVRARPELFTAYVGTGQVASWVEGVNAQFDFLMRTAKENHNSELLSQLEAIGRPDPLNTEQVFAFSRPIRQYVDAADAAWLAGLRDRGRYASSLTDADMQALGDGMNFSGKTLLATEVKEDLSTTALTFRVPYFVIQGQDDLFTPTVAAEAYFARVSAPKKELFLIEQAGHFALVTHSARFIQILKRVSRQTAHTLPGIEIQPPP